MEMSNRFFHFLIDFKLARLEQAFEVGIKLKAEFSSHESIVHFKSQQKTGNCKKLKIFDEFREVDIVFIQLEKLTFFFIFHDRADDVLNITVQKDDSKCMGLPFDRH